MDNENLITNKDLSKFNPQENYLDELAKILAIPRINIKTGSKRIEKINSTYYYNTNIGGKKIIVSDDGTFLVAESTTSFKRLLEEFINGKRNGKFIKEKCYSCGNEMVINVTNIPKNVSTFDIRCPKCKTFIRFGNPNYERKFECLHRWILTDKVPEISKKSVKKPDGTEKDVYYHIYRCEKCNEEKVMSDDEFSMYKVKSSKENTSAIKQKNKKISKDENNEIDDFINKIDNKIIELINKEFEEISINFKNNKNIDKVFNHVNELFKKTNYTTKYKYWIEPSKEVLVYILVKLLETNGTIKYDDVRKIFNDNHMFIEMCKNASTTLNDSKLIKIVDHINRSSMKMLNIYYIIIQTQIITPRNETITHNIKFKDNLSFNLTVSKSLGPLIHTGENSYKIGDNIKIMNAKCNSAELLKNSANEWLQNSARASNQTIIDNFNKEYSFKNNQINVIEKAVTKDNKNIYYKFVYNNQTMLIFSYSNKDLSKAINLAIISLRAVREQLVVRRNPFEDPLNNN